MRNDPVNNMPYVWHMFTKFCWFQSHSNICIHFCHISSITIPSHSFSGIELMSVVFGVTNILVLQQILEWNGMSSIPTLFHFFVASLSLLFQFWRKSVPLRFQLSCCSSARCLRYNRFLFFLLMFLFVYSWQYSF